MSPPPICSITLLPRQRRYIGTSKAASAAIHNMPAIQRIPQHEPVALAGLQRAPQMRFGHWPEDQTDDHRRDRIVEAAQHIAEEAEDHQQSQLDRKRVAEHPVGRGIGADGAKRSENQNPAIQPGLWNAEQPHPQADQGEVKHQQHEVGDEKAGNQTPDKVGIVGEELRAGLQSELLERRQHDCRRGGGRQAQRQQRHQRTRGRRVVRGLGTGNAFDRALAEFLRILGELSLGRVGQEARNIGATGRHRPDREANRGSSKPGLPRPFPILAGHHHRALRRTRFSLRAIRSRRHC